MLWKLVKLLVTGLAALLLGVALAYAGVAVQIIPPDAFGGPLTGEAV